MLRIGGLQKITLIDYPGKIAATIFLAGCNFRCGYCHNPDLVEIKKEKDYLTEKEILNFLRKRRGLLEGVCIGGGEPLLQQDLLNFLAKIKILDYSIKLDTNGFNFLLLKTIIEKGLIDYIAMDIKSSFKHYKKIVNTKFNINNIKKSIKLIKESGLNYEFRTTVLPKFHNQKEIEKIAQQIKGAELYYLQNFRNKTTLDPEFSKEPNFIRQELLKMKQIAEKYVKKCEIRD